MVLAQRTRTEIILGKLVDRIAQTIPEIRMGEGARRKQNMKRKVQRTKARKRIQPGGTMSGNAGEPDHLQDSHIGEEGDDGANGKGLGEHED